MYIRINEISMNPLKCNETKHCRESENIAITQYFENANLGLGFREEMLNVILRKTQ